jgi:hypothetical protein
MSVERLLILDFDGVIRSGRLNFKLDPVCVAYLNMLLVETQASVVVSSSWRGDTVEPMRALLQSWGVWARVVGVTPDLSRYDGQTGLYIGGTREQEILQWLAKHDASKRFVILDDEDAGFDVLRPWLVLTDHEVGLTARDVEQACRILLE